MTNNNQNTTKKSWDLPSITLIPSGQINGGGQGALAVTLDNAVFLEHINKPTAFKAVLKPVTNVQSAPSISLLRFAGYCVVLILMLPLLLIGTKRPAHKFY
jgi:hypothetical protein